MKNRKLFVSIIAGLMAVLMFMGLVVSLIPTHANAASSGEIQAQIDSLREEQEKIEEQLAALNAEKAANYEEIENIVAEKYNLEQQINLLVLQIKNVNEQISAMNTLIADKQDELDSAQARFDDLSEKNKERIRAMEEEGKLSYWSVLFKANSFSDFLDRLNMIREIAAADNRRIRELGEAADELAASKKTLEDSKSDLEVTKITLHETENTLHEKQEDAQKMLNLLMERQEEYIAMIREGEDAEAALIAEIGLKESELEEALWEEWLATSVATTAPRPTKPKDPTNPTGDEEDDPGDWGEYDEGWIAPCYYVCVTDGYGWRTHPFGGYESFHSGVDLAAAEGTPIYAARSGIVTTAVYHWSFGNYVTINHGDGYASMYAHMMYSVVSAGEYVRQGQLIGYMGETGEATGPHLHFVIYYNGSTVNPMDYI